MNKYLIYKYKYNLYTWSTRRKFMTGFFLLCCRQTVSMTVWSAAKQAVGEEKF